MSIVRLDNVTKRFGGEPVLEGIGFRVEEGEKIGLIGRNGTGKTTLFRLITGEVQPDDGLVERQRSVRIAHLAQFPDVALDASVFEVAMRSFGDLADMETELQRLEARLASGDETAMKRYSVLQEEFQHRGGYEYETQARRVLQGLGFTREEFTLTVSALSGGQRTRLMLALILLEDADLLLLDEPENHLDMEAREWLEGFLKENRRAFVMVSHDRHMLNAVVNRIVEVEYGSLSGYTGNYDAYLAAKVLLTDQHQKAFERQQQFVEKEQRWINRFRAKSTKASQVQSRIKRLEKLERIQAPPPEARKARFKMGEAVRAGRFVVETKDLSMAYGDLTLYSGVSFQVERGERVGIIGPNGSGKTTLLRHLAGQLPDGRGSVKIGHKVSVGFYEQHHESLSRDNDIFAEIKYVRPEMAAEQIRSFMGRFLFVGDDVFKPISALSGGEVSRVTLAKLILSNANLLLLDEPTNHLDIASREALEAALEEFEGTIIAVSHDRALIDRISDKLIVVEDGKAEAHLGNYTDYRRRDEQAKAAAEEPIRRDAMKIRHNNFSKGKRQRKDNLQEKALRQQRKRLEELESDIAALESTVTEVEARFAEVDPANYEQAQGLKAEYDGLKADLKEMYEEWERLAEDSPAAGR
jgi:ATP-binding cassette, subfamily F, member 3